MPLLDGVDEEFQLVHEDDVVSALIALLDGKHGGAFNLAGDGVLTWGARPSCSARRRAEISLKNMKRFNGADVAPARAPDRGAARQPRLPPLPLGRLDREAEDDRPDWKPRFDTLETFKITMRARGVLPEAPTAVQTPTAPVA